MNKSGDNTELLSEIRDLLKSIELRQKSNERMSEGDALIEKVEDRTYDALNNLQNSFDRIHDKLFAFNSMLIIAFLGLSKYPYDNPILRLWVVFLPILSLIFLVWLEIKQMEIHRHTAKEMEWIEKDRIRYRLMIRTQNRRSLFAIIFTIGIFSYLIIKILLY